MNGFAIYCSVAPQFAENFGMVSERRKTIVKIFEVLLTFENGNEIELFTV